MKDQTEAWIDDGSRPDKPALEVITFCLRRLYADKKHMFQGDVVDGLTFEELIGALLMAKDLATERQEEEEDFDVDESATPAAAVFEDCEPFNKDEFLRRLGTKQT